MGGIHYNCIRGGGQVKPCLHFDQFIGEKFMYMTKSVSNMDICFIKVVLLLCEHGHFLLNFALQGLSSPPPHTIRVYLYKNVPTKLEGGGLGG